MGGRVAEGAAAVDDRLPHIRIVLVRPRGSANVGAAARAMKNMGVGELTLVRPAVRRFKAAEAMAVHARDLVRGARVVATLAEAVADCALVVGTTCRGGPYRAGTEDPDALAPRLLAASAQGPVAVLFGPEDHGLTNDDLRACQRLISIDTSAAYASLNLAQAVLLVCAALRRAACAGQRVAPMAEPAPAAAVQRMYDHLQRALLSIGFLHPQNPDHIMFALRRLFGRTELEDHEVRILLGMARQIEWAGRKTVNGARLPVTGGGHPGGEGGDTDADCAWEEARAEAGASHRARDTGRRSRSARHG